MSASNCCFLACIQVYQETGKVVWHSHFFKNCPQCFVIYTVKGFSLVNEAEVFFFFILLLFLMLILFLFPMDVGNLISGSSVFSKASLYWKFSIYVEV